MSASVIEHPRLCHDQSKLLMPQYDSMKERLRLYFLLSFAFSIPSPFPLHFKLCVASIDSIVPSLGF
jgi:hypothetical protein